jgi:1,2-diacylglycerol 3-beta-glucosyltransferase
VPDTALGPQAKMPLQRESSRFDILIFARDEADVLPGSLAALTPQLAPDDRLTVIADHCRDATARVARAMGAHVLYRHHGPPGKGHALKWWLKQTSASGEPDDWLIVLDADSWARPGFLAALRTHLSPAKPVVQTLLEQPAHGLGGAGSLASLSEFAEQNVTDRLKEALGWPVRLRGTGMAIQRQALEGIAPQLETVVEDAELTLLFGAARFPICLAPSARVLDAKPETDAAAVRQRARWLKGQWQLVRRHPGSLLALLLQGPKGWALISSLLLRPKSLTLVARGAAWLGLLMAGNWGGMAVEVLKGVIVASVLIDVIGLSVAVCLSPDRGASLKALLRLPVFVLVWLRSLLMAANSREGWLRTRQPSFDGGVSSPGPAAS